MPFPLGGDFSRSVQNTFKILKSDRQICVQDNGTNICDAGHKLQFPGTCFDQQIGTFNSTHATFQPTFPICTTDYESTGFHSGIVFQKENPEVAHPVFTFEGGVETSSKLVQLAQEAEATYTVFRASIEKESEGALAQLSNGIAVTIFEQTVPPAISSFRRMAQFRPGALPHLPGAFSDLYVYDVFSAAVVYNRLVIRMLEILAPRIKQDTTREMTKNLVQTDYYTTISGSEDVCQGDEQAPFITYVEPAASGTHLRPRNQAVEFLLSDAVAGVDLSTIDVTLTSTSSGTIQLVNNGADQTGGDVSITGDSSSYRIRYVPDFLWSHNDIVVVTISGSDLPPTVGGNPFFCGAAGTNAFVGDIRFQVLNFQDLSASITAVGDTTPPFISRTVPASGTDNNSVFSPIIIDIRDALTGVDLSTMTVSVDGLPIIVDGVATSDETVIDGSSGLYTITYTPESAFEYGSIVPVTVVAYDLAQSGPNLFSTTYDVSFVEDSTLIIENFAPPIGTSVNLHEVDISVDLRDDTHGVDESQSFLVINGTIVSGTVTPLASGINITYHPPNNYAFDEPIRVIVHGVNGNVSAPVVKEDFYTLFYGYRILYPNDGGYLHADSVDVFVRARNNERLFRDLSTGYFFTAYTQPSSDFGASIVAINPIANLSASIIGQGPEHRYGQTITVEFFVKDVDGHELGPYTFTYTIEESP